MMWLVVWLTLLAGARAQEFGFVQMCDPQFGLSDYQADRARFSQAVKQINDLKPDFVVICGDLVQHPDRKSFADFNAAKAELRVPCYCAPGNHDVGERPAPPSLRLYRECIGKDYYSFDHKGCAFIVVDTQLWKVRVPDESEKHDAWFKETLAAAAKQSRRIFLVGHVPLFAKTPEEPDGHDNLPLEKRREVLALCARYGVQVSLAGHAHRTFMKELDGLQLVASETTSFNIDFRSFGFRLWHIDAARPYRHEFVPLKLEPASATGIEEKPAARATLAPAGR